VCAHRGLVDEISPWVYGLSPDGAIVPQYGPGAAAGIEADLTRLRAAGLPIAPSLANATAEGFCRRPVAAIAELVGREGYAGIDIDYEELLPEDGAAFTAFLTELADEVRLMGYDYHGSTSPPGPIAPIGWIRDMLDYATTRVEPGKLALGVGLYCYDWAGGHGTMISWRQATDRATGSRATVRRDPESQSPTFSYTGTSGARHEVWFEDAESSRAKFRAAATAGIGGVFFWMFGEPDPQTYPALRDTLPKNPGRP
jgi:spore germination protein YaaH